MGYLRDIIGIFYEVIGYFFRFYQVYSSPSKSFNEADFRLMSNLIKITPLYSFWRGL